jgi:hypothetical protein
VLLVVPVDPVEVELAEVVLDHQEQQDKVIQAATEQLMLIMQVAVAVVQVAQQHRSLVQ